MKIQMKKFAILICIIIFSIIIVNEKSFSQELYSEQYINEILYDEININDINNYIDKSFENIDLNTNEISFENIVEKLFDGEIKYIFNLFISFITDNVFKEIKSVLSTFISMFSVMILSTVLKNVTSSFCSKSVGELGFYICYIIMILSVCNIFYEGVNIASETIKSMGEFLNITIPVFITILISSGNIGEGVFMAPFVSMISTFIINFISMIILPCAVTISTFDIINYISEREFLKSLTEFLKKCISMMLKGSAILFTLILSLQKIALPTLTGSLGKSAKAIIGTIPVIGDIMQGTIETGIVFITALKGSISLGVIIFILVICSIPFMKLCIIFIIYKITSAISEPFCDKRLIGCIDCVTDFVLLIIGALVTATIIFIFSIIMLISSNII